jgi:hypothetical protein
MHFHFAVEIMPSSESERAKKSWEDFERRIEQLDKEKEDADSRAKAIYLKKLEEAKSIRDKST